MQHKSLISLWCRGTELNCRHGDFQSFDTLLHFNDLQEVRTKKLGASHFFTPFSTRLHTPPRPVLGIIQNYVLGNSGHGVSTPPPSQGAPGCVGRSRRA